MRKNIITLLPPSEIPSFVAKLKFYKQRSKIEDACRGVAGSNRQADTVMCIWWRVRAVMGAKECRFLILATWQKFKKRNWDKGEKSKCKSDLCHSLMIAFWRKKSGVKKIEKLLSF